MTGRYVIRYMRRPKAYPAPLTAWTQTTNPTLYTSPLKLSLSQRSLPLRPYIRRYREYPSQFLAQRVNRAFIGFEPTWRLWKLHAR